MLVLRNALVAFIVANTALLVVFFFVRVPLMTAKHYTTDTGAPPRRWQDSLLLSAMVQTTVGAYNGLSARSTGARWVETIQALSTFVAVGVVLLLAFIAATKQGEARTTSKSA